MTRPPHLGLRHLALNVRALEAMTAFYVEVLGFRIDWQPDADNVYLTSGGDNVALHRAGGHTGPPLQRDHGDTRPEPNVDGGPSAGAAGALDHLGLMAGTADDVDAWAAFLDERGVTIDARPRTHRDGSRSIYFRDPDGNRIQIIWIPTLFGESVEHKGHER